MSEMIALPIAGNPSPNRANGVVEVVAPFDRAVIATLACAGEAEIEQALASAYALYRHRDGWLKPHQRITILERLMVLMAEQSRRLAFEAAREGGKPLLDSEVEVARAIDGIRSCIDQLRTHGGEVVPMGVNLASSGRVAFTTNEPIGVVVAVSAFNHPLNLIVHQVAAAVAVGCPVIVKPARATPLSCYSLIRLLAEAGLPEGWAQALVVSDNKLATRLVCDARVGFFSFIGSAQVGWELRAQLAPGTRCALEHGGVAAVIVSADADLEVALPKLLKGGFYHAGQVCVSVQRVFAHASIARELAERLAEGAKRLVIGDPLEAATEVGPLIEPSEGERIDRWVREAVDAGAELLCGGGRRGESCYEATVLYDPPAAAKVSNREVFGPVVCVYPYQDEGEAIARANALPFAFQAAIFTRDIDRALHAWRNLDASAVMVNDHTAFRVDWMPFAGLRESGLGVGGLPHTMRDMQVEKMVVIHSPSL